MFPHCLWYKVLYRFWLWRRSSLFPLIKSSANPIRYLSAVTWALIQLPSNIDHDSKGQSRLFVTRLSNDTSGWMRRFTSRYWAVDLCPCKDKKWKPGQGDISFTGMTSVSLRPVQALVLLSQGKHDTIPCREKKLNYTISAQQILTMRSALDGCVVHEERLSCYIKIDKYGDVFSCKMWLICS